MKINEIINSEINLLNIISEQSKIYGIQDLSKMGETFGIPENFFLKRLIKAFKIEGDEGVINTFKDITGLDINPISKGKYEIIY